MKKNNKKEKKSFLIYLGDFIAKYRYVFLVIFLLLTIFCAFNINNVKVNDSITDYLPDDTETKYGLNIMEDEFGSLTTIKLMIHDISLEDANLFVEKLSQIENIENVSFDGTENSYKDEKALYTIQLVNQDDEKIDSIKEDIENLLQKESYDIYSESFENPTDGIDLVLILAVIVIIVTLLITSKTYFEPVIAFIVFGISIVLNMGSNFLLGEISYITQAIAVVLQLALSIDYVIIFMNQFMKEISDTDDKLLAMKKTTSKAMPEIFASSLTTISGLLALVLMQLKIGGDIGIVLSKGIICSLLTVILVMPSLLSIFDKMILKCKKKEKKHDFGKLSSFIVNKRKILLPIFIIFVVIGICFIPKYHYVYNTNSIEAIRTSKNIKALQNIETTFETDNMLVILVKSEEKDYQKELEITSKLKELDKVTSITSIGSYPVGDNLYLGTGVNYQELATIFQVNKEITLNLYKYYANANQELEKLENINNYRISLIDLIYFFNENSETLKLPEELKVQVTTYYNMVNDSITLLESDDYSRFILNLNAKTESEETEVLIDEIRALSKDYYTDVTLVGNSINAMDLESSFTSDNIMITGITILFIAIILLCTFKSFWMTVLLILTIEGSILVNFGIMTLFGKDIFFMSYVVVSAIQMGATIDYAIVLSSRYLQLRKKMDKKEALIGTLKDSLPAIITSGLILLIAGILIGFIATSPVISSIGLFLGVGTFISLLATIFMLPAILYLLDFLIIKKKDKQK
ncbi:MAG: MMPL family transporter [bacterium]|nr:MMPL family transporter [bacterium]